MTMLRMVWFAVLFTALGSVVSAAERKVYFFGNSLVNHASDTDETTVPYWLAALARAGGHQFRADGQWGFLKDFSRAPQPLAQWGFKRVQGAWDQRAQTFASVGWDAVVITPGNFIQYRAPDKTFEWENPTNATPLSATLQVIDRYTGDAPILIYEGWAEMEGTFPPRARKFAAYKAFNTGDYHQWFEQYVANLRAARPKLDVGLIPVAKVIAELTAAGGPLAGLSPQALYIDADPHGTPTTYLLAAMVSYSVLYGEAAPAGLALPESIAPQLRDSYELVAREIADKLGIAPQKAGAAPAQTGAPAVGVADPAMAMGLNGIADWSTQQPFIDIMKTARPWVGHEGSHWAAWDAKRLEEGGYLDKHGWLKALPPTVDRVETYFLTEQDKRDTALGGKYRIRWKGSGKLAILGRARQVRMGDHEAWFNYTPGEGLVALSISATDPGGTGDYIRDIDVVREDQIALFEVGVIFNPAWIARIADLRALRFMDWMLTNGSPVTTWAGRPVVENFSYVWRGVPAEVMIALANRVGADPWFNMPHAADDDYSEHFARMVLARLDPRLKVYVEYSNELWNFGFPQARWAGEQAKKRWGDKAGDGAWMQFVGMRAAQVMRAWAGVYGKEHADQLVRVVAVHTGWPGLEEPLLDAPLWRAEPGQGNLSPAAHFDAYAVSGYFGYELGTDEEDGRLSQMRKWLAESRAAAEKTFKADGLQRRALEAAVAPVRFDQAIPRAAKAVRDGSFKELTETLWPYHAKAAKRYGLRLIMYEGGTHVVGHGEAVNDEDLTAFFEKFNYSPEMAALYRDELAAWRKLTGGRCSMRLSMWRSRRNGALGGRCAILVMRMGAGMR
ncbi:calcium-binding protein [Aquicoccus sp. G2-2]|uniref:calcium-binding protein n=1 Tax=Aquicoccus sp. G2-2 TaxID=3092120 RepID=UPI002ADF199A|nr:calcium-binding protein [Aquicoccus sp. G2-2]MEA1112578.1 calcium-binding protein [Aquicoccus sp. G2-2]